MVIITDIKMKIGFIYNDIFIFYCLQIELVSTSFVANLCTEDSSICKHRKSGRENVCACVCLCSLTVRTWVSCWEQSKNESESIKGASTHTQTHSHSLSHSLTHTQTHTQWETLTKLQVDVYKKQLKLCFCDVLSSERYMATLSTKLFVIINQKQLYYLISFLIDPNYLVMPH